MIEEVLNQIDETLSEICHRETVSSKDMQNRLLDMRLVLMGEEDGSIQEEPRVEVGAAIGGS